MPNYIYPNMPEMGPDENHETQAIGIFATHAFYDNVSAYTSPKAVAFDLATIFRSHTTLFRRSTQLDRDTDRTAHIAVASFHATRLTDLQVPTFFVERDLLMALFKTAPPDAIDWKALHLPFNAGVFILPAGGNYLTGAESAHLAAC